MENKMFCYQCEQTAGCTGCTQSGVCGKSARETHAANAPAVGFHDEIVLRFVLSCEVVAAGLEEHSVQLQYAFFAERNVRITAVDKV